MIHADNPCVLLPGSIALRIAHQRFLVLLVEPLKEVQDARYVKGRRARRYRSTHVLYLTRLVRHTITAGH